MAASSSPKPFRIAVAHPQADRDWTWVLGRLPNHPDLEIESFKIGGEGSGKRQSLSAARALWSRHRLQPFDLVLSFRPMTATWVELTRMGQKARHDLYGFNVTNLPLKLRRAVMSWALRQLHQAFVFTRYERDLYASHFGLDQARITVVPWATTPPAASSPPLVEGEYLAALGGEARDYATLIEAAKLLPGHTFVVVARPWNLAGLSIPPNVIVYTDLPKEDAWNIVAHSRFHILPLESTVTPCGIVTLLGAMHLGKAQIVTSALGVNEYSPDGATSLQVQPGDPARLAEVIETLSRDQKLRGQLGVRAAHRAAANFTEQQTIRMADDYLTLIAKDPDAKIGDVVLIP
jgi:glycosyltransferase involved in cell wall biosynthesis